MTNSTGKDDLDIEFISYPAGSRFIGLGDDVVISAEKLENYIKDKVQSKLTELKALLPKKLQAKDRHNPSIEYRISAYNEAIDQCTEVLRQFRQKL